MSLITRVISVNWGTTGAAMFYRVIDGADASLIARTNTGVAEYPAGSGLYRAKITTWDTSWIGRIVWDDGTNYADETFDASMNYLDGIKAKTDTINAATGIAVSPSVSIDANLIAGTGVRWNQTFTASGVVSTGWTAFAFTIKRDQDNDDDGDALLCVRVSNPGGGGDGLRVTNRQTAADATQASLVVSATTPDTVVALSASSTAMQLPPSPSDGYYWELTRWTGTVKERIGRGRVVIERTVRRGVSIP